MKRKNVLITILALSLLIVGTSLITYNFLERKSNIITLHSLEIQYSDIKSIVDKSDLIIIGEINKVKEDITIDHRDYYKLNGSETKETFTPIYSTYSVSDVKVDKVLKGNIADKSFIELLQEYDNPGANNSDLKNIEKFKEKDKYILFLRYYDVNGSEQAKKDFKTSKYFLVSPTQGNIKISGNSIIVSGNINPIFKNGTSIEEIEKMIKEQL